MWLNVQKEIDSEVDENDEKDQKVKTSNQIQTGAMFCGTKSVVHSYLKQNKLITKSKCLI